MDNVMLWATAICATAGVIIYVMTGAVWQVIPLAAGVIVFKKVREHLETQQGD